MKRIHKLTERDLSRIVRNLLKENVIASTFNSKIQSKPGIQTVGWPQKAGATGTWKEEGGAILLFDGSGEQIGSIEG